MFDTLKKLRYGARVLLSRGGGQPETVTVNGRPTVILHGGEGPPFVYLHSTLGESLMWLPFSWIIGHWVGTVHALARTALVTAAWYLFPTLRFVVIPAELVGADELAALAGDRHRED